MNKDALEKRLNDLNATSENQKKVIEKAIADFNALEGAKQDTIYWLNQLALLAQQPASQSQDTEINPIPENAPELVEQPAA